MTAAYSVAANATPGNRGVKLSNTLGETEEVDFTVAESPDPWVAGINYWGGFTGARGTSGYIEIYGGYLGPGATVEVSSSGVTATVSWSGQYNSPYYPWYQINVYCTVDQYAAAGTYYLTVTTPGGTANYPIVTLQ